MKKQVNNMKKLLIATALLGSSAGMVFVNTGVSYAAEASVQSEKKDLQSISLHTDSEKFRSGDTIWVETVPNGASFDTYKWTRDDGVVVAETSGWTSHDMYTLTEADVGHTITCEVTLQDNYAYNDGTWSATTPVVTKFVAKKINSAQITGGLYTGNKVKITTDPSITADDCMINWTAHDRADCSDSGVSLGSGLECTLPSSGYNNALGKYIKVTITGKDNSDFRGETKIVKTTEAVKKGTAIGGVTVSKVSGSTDNTKYQVGDVLSADMTKTDENSHVTYRWIRRSVNKTTNNVKHIILGATGRQYKVTREDIGYYVYAEVTGNGDDGYTGTSDNYNDYSNNAYATTSVTENSTIYNDTQKCEINKEKFDLVSGDTLSLRLPDGVNQNDVNIQWYKSASTSISGYTAGKGIAVAGKDDYTTFDKDYVNIYNNVVALDGTTGLTYTVKPEDGGCTIFAVIKDKGNSNFVYRSITNCSKTAKALVSSYKLVGEPVVGQTLHMTSDLGDVDFPEVRWYRGRGWNEITGNRNKYDYTITADDVGHTIRCEVNGKSTKFTNMDRTGSSNFEAATSVVRAKLESTVTFINNMASGEDSRREVTIDKSYINLDNYTPSAVKGYKFTGWSDQSGATVSGKVDISGDTTFTANWQDMTIRNVNIVYDGELAHPQPGTNVRADIPQLNGHDPDHTTKWYLSDDGINKTGESIGTGDTLLVPDSAYGKYLIVEVTGTGEYYGTATDVSAKIPDNSSGQPGTGEVTKKQIESATITGKAEVGQWLSVNITPADATADITWYISDDGTTPGEYLGTGTGITINNNNAMGKYIIAVVTGNGNYEGTVTACTDTRVKQLQRLYWASIQGPSTVGSTVWLNVGPSEATYRAEWYVSDRQNYLETLVGTTITGESFTIPASAKGKYLMVKVTGTGEYYDDYIASVSSKINCINYASIENYDFGKEASIYVNPDGATYNVEWFLSDNNDTSDEANLGTSLGTSQTVLVTNDFVNKYLKAKVTGTGDYDGTVFTASEQIGKLSSVDIDGHFNVGETLKASVYPEAATFDATWYHADEKGNKTGDPIGTGSTYTLKESDLGARIYVEATGTGNYSGTVNSCHTWETVEAALKKVTSYNFVKKNKVGETMEFTYLPADATLMMYWERQDTNSEKDDTNITLAEDVSQYTIKEDDKGKYIRLSVNGKGDYASFEYTSGWIKILDDDINITKELTSASITGELTVGKNISLKVEPTDATYNVNWYISDDGVKISDGTPIGTGNNFTIPEKALGKYIIGEASGTGDYAGSVKKAASDVVVKANTDVTQQVLITLINDKATSENLKRQEINIDKNGTLNLDNYKPSDVEGFVFKGWEDANTGKIVTGKITASDSGKYIAKWEAAGTDVTTPGTRIPNSKENVEYTEIDTDKVFNGHKQGVKVYVSQGQDIAVQLPFKAVLDGKKGARNKADFKVQVRANIAGDDNVKVIPESAFTMTTPGKNDINGTVTVDQTEFNIKKDTEEALATGKIINGTVEAFNVSAGHWEGGFSWTISVEGMKIDNSTESTEDIVVKPGN